MFVFVRFVISIVFFLCLVMIVRKKGKKYKGKYYAIFITVTIALYISLSFMPFENLFLTFDSPESAYEYFVSRNANIELVVDGNNCDLIVERKKDEDTLLLIPKTEKGWKISTGSNLVRVSQKLSDGFSINIYRYKNSSDYFITILNINGGVSEIFDDCNTVFYSLEKRNNYLNKDYVTYYAHLTEFTSEYYLDVNGNRITFD